MLIGDWSRIHADAEYARATQGPGFASAFGALRTWADFHGATICSE
jgi:hypothetical protein